MTRCLIILAAGLSLLAVTPSVYAATCDSVTTGTWDNAATWSCGAVPSSIDDVTVVSPHVVTLNTFEAAQTTTVFGTLDLANNSSSNLTTSGLTVDAAGRVQLDDSSALSSSGAIQIDGNILPLPTATFGSGQFFVDAGTTSFGGSGSIDILTNIRASSLTLADPIPAFSVGLTFDTTDTAGATFTVNGTLVVTGQLRIETFNPNTVSLGPGSIIDLAGDLTGGGNVVFDTGSELRLEGEDFNFGSFSGANITYDGTVTYDGTTAQKIEGRNYYNLTLDATASPEFFYYYDPPTVYNDFTIRKSGHLQIAESSVLSGPGANQLVMEAVSRFDLEGNNAKTPPAFATFPKGFTGYQLDPTSTVEYSAAANQIIDGTPAYGNLIVTSMYQKIYVGANLPPASLEGGEESNSVTSRQRAVSRSGSSVLRPNAGATWTKPVVTADLNVLGFLQVLDDGAQSPADNVILDMAGFNLSVTGDVLGNADEGFDALVDGTVLFSGTEKVTVGGSWEVEISGTPATATFNGTGTSFSSHLILYPLAWNTLTIAGGPYQIASPSSAQSLFLTNLSTLAPATGRFSVFQQLGGDGSLSGTLDVDGPTTVSGSPFISQDIAINPAATLTNTGNLNVLGGVVSQSSGGSFVAGSGSLLAISGATPLDPSLTFDFSTNQNILVFAGGNQSVPSLTYSELSLQGSGTKTAAGDIVAAELVVASGVTFDSSTGLKDSFSRSINIAGTYLTGTKTIVFNGSTLQFLTAANPLSFSNLTIQQNLDLTSGTDLTITGTLDLGTNVLTVNGPTPLTLDSTSNVSEAGGYIQGPVKQIVTAGQTKTLPVGVGGVVAPVTITVDATTASPASIQVTAVGTTEPNAPAGSLDLYWQLTPTNIGQADVTFRYADSDVVGNESQYQLARWDGTQWVVPPGANVDTTNNIASAPNVTAFSPWTLIPFASCTVSNLADGGGGSLRQAITDANAGLCNVIDFTVSGTIQITTELPALTQTTGVLIDGFTAPGSSADTAPMGSPSNAIRTIVVETEPANYIGTNMLQISGSNNIITGIHFHDTNASQTLFVTGPDNTIAGNELDTGVSQVVISGAGATGNLIGGPNPSDRNVFHSASNFGVELSGPFNTVEGNTLGFDMSGAPAGSGGSGIHTNSVNGNVIAANVISNNAQFSGAGVEIFGGTGTQITDNWIGTGLDGTGGLGNGVGSSSGPVGILLSSTSGNTVTSNVITGHDGAGFATGGIYIDGSDTNTLAGNTIGLDVTSAAAPNSYGIFIASFSDQNVIGGGNGINTISSNTLDGVAIVDTSGSVSTAPLGNKVVENIIESNGDLPIDLADDGLTANDAGDADIGPNNLQNFPTLNSAWYDSTAGTVQVHFALDSSSSGAGGTLVELARVDATGILEPLGAQCFAGAFFTNQSMTTPSGGVVSGSSVAALATSYADTGCTTLLDGTSELGTPMVVNTYPIANADSAATNEDTAVTINVVANDTDAEDGTPVLVSVGPAVNGTTAIVSGQVQYTPNANFFGTDSFSYTVQDSGGLTASATVTVTVNAVNDPPVAANDAYSTSEDTVLTVPAPGVLSNDTDADGDPLTAVLVTTTSNGTLTLNSDGSFTYTPNADFNGSDSFTYQAFDGAASSNTATVTLTVNAANDPPVAANDAYSTSEDTVLTVPAPGVLSNDTDADGDPLTAVLVTTTSNGTLTLNSDGSFTYTPNANFNGSDSFTYQAFDGSASSNTATVTLTVNAVNDPPVANPDSASTSFETSVVINVVSNDTDVDGDTLTVSGNTQPANGSASCSGTSCTYTPAAGFTGTDSFNYTVSDGNGGTDTTTVNVTVLAATDADLQITKTGPGTATRGSQIDFTIMVKNNGPGSALNVVVDDTSDPGLEHQDNSGDCTTAFPCNLGTLSSGQTKVITSTFGVIGAGSLSNTASVSSSTADPNTSNNTSTAVVNACPSAPTGLQPSGTINNPQSGTLGWNGSADRFVVFLGPAGAGCNTRLGETTDNSISYSGLDPNTEYDWRVVAISDGCIEASSSCVRFTTGGECGTEAPELISPDDNSAPTTPVLFQWSSVEGVSGYVVYAGAEGEPMNEVARTSQNETSASVAIGPGRVQWRVEALYGTNCPPVSSRTGAFTAVLAGECREEKPQNINPAQGASNLASPLTFSWIGVDGATGYRVWVAIEDEFPVVVATTSGATSATAEVPSGQLFWYVQALFDGCPPTISDPTSFSVAPGSNCPTDAAQLIAPQNGETVAGEVTFEWTEVSGAVRYAVWASVDGDAPAIVGTTTDPTLTRRMDFGEIEWFVQTFFGGCPAIFSERNTFDSVEDFECPTGVAQPLLPADGASFSNALVAFSWTPVDGADGYRVLGRFGGIGEFEVIGSSLAGTELQIPIEGSFLEWKVETVFIGCPPTESITRSLEINQIACSTEVSELLLPAVQSTLPDERVLMTWTLVDGAAAYEVWVASIDGVPSKVALTDGLTTDVEVDLDEGVYQWWVNAVLGGECDKTRSENGSFSVDFPSPDACDSESELVLISPSEGAAELVSPIILEWTAVPDATSYRIFTINPAGVATPFGPVRESNQAVVQFEPGIVRWYVVANRAACSPLRSPIQHFRVESGAECDVPDRPSLRVPQKVASDTEYRVAWDQVPGATVYEVQEAPVPVFAGVPVQVVNGTTASFIHTVEAGRRSFFYRVRAIGDCNGERGNYSSVARVFVDASSVSETDALSRGGLTTMAEDVPGGFATVELNKDSLSRKDIEQFTVTLTGDGTFQVVPDQPWLTVEPEIVTLTPAGVQVTVFAEMGDLPLGSNQASLDLIPVAGKNGVTTNQTGGTVGVSVAMVTPVSSQPKNEPLPESLIIPAVAHTNGANGSTWLSDVRLSNVGSTAQKYQLNFTPSSTDGTREGQSTTIDVKPGSSVALNDLLANWFGAVEENASGLLEIRPLKATTSSSIGGLAAVASGGPASLASSRTYNFTPEGTFGHYVPAIRFDQFVGTTVPEGETKPVLSMQQIAQSSAFRTNLGLVEASGNATTAQVTIFSASGAQLGQFLVPMQAGSHVQLNAVLAQNNIFVENGRIEVEAVEGDGKLMAYAAVIDNRTNDPQLVQAVSKNSASGRRWVIPGVADIDTGAASWRTDTRIYNAGNQSVEATLTFYPQADPGSPITRSVTINSGETFVADDILQSLFGVNTNGGAVHVETAQNAQLIATARTYDLRSDGGTVGQFIPAQAADRGTAVGERALQILQVEQSDRFRANIGLAETTGNPVVVEVSAIVPGAKAAPRIRVNLQGNQFTQLLKVLETLGVPNSYNSRVAIKVVGGSGRVVAYGSIIDNITQDPTYVPAQ
ncbi:MAG: tandem-95 repeat protein [Acidobacteria bacterium]|nr:tandem-95 repeat protein [Acidobacteriota bacterium]